MEHYYTQQPSWQFKTQLPHCQIWQHSHTHAIAQAYLIDNFQRTHARLNRNRPHLVSTFGAVTDNRTGATYLLVERVPNRLSSLATLNESQTLRILYSVFRGLEELQDIFGVVAITEACVCFNQTGRVKIWINPDLSCLQPFYMRRESGYNEISLVIAQVIKMVEKKCFNPCFLNNFIKKLKQKKINSYDQAAEEVLAISQLLFIDIDEKPRSGQSRNLPMDKVGGHYTPEKSYNFSKNLKTQREEPKIPGRSQKIVLPGQNKQLQAPTKLHHKKSHSFFENQITRKDSVPAIISKQMTAQSNKQSIFDEMHKSAPLSPRESLSKNSTRPLFFSKRGNKQQNSLSKYPEDKKNLPAEETNRCLKKSQTEAAVLIIDDAEDELANDSFSNNLAPNGNETLVEGEFKTFGVLQEIGEANREGFCPSTKSKKSQFNIQEMENQIEKKLNKNKEKKFYRVSITQNIKPSQPEPARSVNNTNNTARMATRQPNQRPRESYPIFPSTSKEAGTKKLCYIDKKYQEYIHCRYEPRRTAQPEPRKTAQPELNCSYRTQKASSSSLWSTGNPGDRLGFLHPGPGEGRPSVHAGYPVSVLRAHVDRPDCRLPTER